MLNPSNPVIDHHKAIADAIEAGLSMLAERRAKIEESEREERERRLRDIKEEWAPYLAVADEVLPAWTKEFMAAIPADVQPAEADYSVFLNIPTCTRIRVNVANSAKRDRFRFFVDDTIVRFFDDDEGEYYVRARESGVQYGDFHLALGIAFETSAKLQVAKQNIEEAKAKKEAELAEKASADPFLSLEKLRKDMDQRYLQGLPTDYRFEVDYALKTGNSTEAIVHALMLISDKLSVIANAL